MWALGAYVLAAIWLFLAPPAVGGQTSYVVTSGISMEPRFHTGDLALVRQQDSYAVGDVIAYHSPTLGEVVLHRINSGDAGGFRTKGDNNSWLDPDTVSGEEILGKLWVHVPKAGAFLHARTLVPVAVLLAAGAVAVPVHSRRKKRGASPRRRPATGQGTANRSAAPTLLTVATVMGVAGTGLVVLAALAPTPASPPATPVSHVLELSYQAQSDATVYQGGTLVTGDPVFLTLNPWIDVALHDRVTGPATTGARTLSLQAQLVGAGGWRYLVPLDGQATGEGADSDLHVHLDLRSLQSVVTQAAARTGIPGDSYQLELLPTLGPADPAGSAAAPVTFPAVVFQVQDGQLVLVDGGTQRGAVVTRKATEPGAAVAPTRPVRQVHLAGISVSAALVTGLGIAALVVAAAAGAVGLIRQRRDPLAGLTQPVITVAAGDLGAGMVMTASVDELFGLARRYNRPVLQLTVAGRPTYAVEEAGTWYGCHVESRPDVMAADTQRIERIRDFAPPPPRRPVAAERAS
jgi:signal peptidase I